MGSILFENHAVTMGASSTFQSEVVGKTLQQTDYWLWLEQE